MSYFDFDSLPVEDNKMIEVMRLTKQLAATQASLLIGGEAGVGKTSLARYIFSRSRSPRIYCLECKNPAGFDFMTIDGGTLLIEDLDCAQPHIQSEIIKLTDRKDSSRPRFISTTRRDLRQLVKQEQFRSDLFYKLAVVNFELPRLQDRSEDFEIIVQFILEVTEIIYGKANLEVSPPAMLRLKSWNWPGNIRELENVLERAVVLTNSNVIQVESILFEPFFEDSSSNFSAGMTLSEVEKKLILQTLEMTSQNRTRAAQILGISIRTLRNKLNEYRGEGVL
jgi:two-component system response regulator AtoC